MADSPTSSSHEATGLVRLPDAVDFVQAATATDGGRTAYGAVIGAGRLSDGERVGIVGLGGLGLTGARIAVLAGAQVYAADPKPQVWGPATERGCARDRRRPQPNWHGSIST